jgi:O-antigen/teichoic acid export membrane protein
LGAYTFAWNLATLPVEKITNLVTRVTPAFFSAVQTEHAALRRYLRTLTEGLALVTFPATIGLGLVAPDFVHLALGKRWEGVIGPLELLALYGSIRCVATLPAQVVIVVGGTRFGMWNSVQAVILMPIAFYIGSHWGTSGIAWGWIVAYPFILAPLYWAVFRRIHMSVAEYWGAVRPALHGCVAMAIILMLLKWAVPAAWPLYSHFGLEVATGSAAYLVVLWVLHRDRVRAFASFAKSMRAGNRGSTEV